MNSGTSGSIEPITMAAIGSPKRRRGSTATGWARVIGTGTPDDCGVRSPEARGPVSVLDLAGGPIEGTQRSDDPNGVRTGHPLENLVDLLSTPLGDRRDQRLTLLGEAHL